MSYIVRVVGYNAYWTGDTEPGKLWSNNLEEARQFDNTARIDESLGRYEPSYR